MKEEYLKKLEELLNENEIEDKDEILSKFQKRYDFGLESELSEEEIEKMLGKPEDVIKKYKNDSKKEETKEFKIYDEVDANYKRNYNLVIKTVGDDIFLIKSDDNLVHLEFDDVDTDSYEIKNDSEEGVYINYRKTKFFGLNRRKSGKITVKVPAGRGFDKVEISTTSGDHYIDKLEGNNVTFSTVSGDADIHKIKCNNLNVQTVSGDFDIDQAEAEKVVFNTVSGDINANEVKSEKLVIDSVSGDVRVKEASSTSISGNSVSGDLWVNGEEYKNLSKRIKEKF